MENKKMLMDEADTITSSKAENRVKVFNNPTLPTSYSLSKELLDAEKELAMLEKKINLGNGLLAKVNDQALILKLQKEKEGFEKQKSNLRALIKKLNYVTASIQDFSVLFVFIRKFYGLVIQKENFEHSGKSISAKLIANLKFEEENLYNAYIDEDCFSKVLLALSLECYQCYFKEYAKNFFDDIRYSNDPYMNSLLILQGIFCQCTYFMTNTFNLTELTLFLSKNIPIDIPLPNTHYELVALYCFFFYELLLEYLKLKTVKTNLDHLKKSINLQLNIVNYKSDTKATLIYGLAGLQESFNKIEKKYNDFIEIKSKEDKETEVNRALVFYNKIEEEIKIINKKTKKLINSKYINLTKMRRMLAIIVNETHLPKFLELFNTKVGNEFSLNKMGKSDAIETNQEALEYLFHAISRDEFYTALDARVNSFINELTEIYSKDDISVLDRVELEDLIEFSFYYIFTLLYVDFNAGLKEFNRKLLYTEVVSFNIFAALKCKIIEKLEKRRNEDINKFFEKIFKNKIDYSLHKKNLLEELKLNLEIIKDASRVLSETTSLEISKLVSSPFPIPEKNSLITLLKFLEKKQKEYDLDYQKVERHKFINKPKFEVMSKANDAHSKKAIEIESSRSIEYFSETLSCLSENLSESLKYIKEDVQDINQFRQKISSALGQIASSIQKLSSILTSWENTNETQGLANLSLTKLLELAKELVIKNTLITRKDHKKELIELQELLNNSCLSIGLLMDQVNSIIGKYHDYNDEAKKTLNILSNFFIKDSSKAQFFAKSLTKKMKRQINEKLSNDYIRLKEQSGWLEKIIRLIKCDADTRVIELYAIIVEADDYQKTCELLNERVNFFKIPNKTLNDSKQTLPALVEKSPNDGKELVLSRMIPLEVKEDVEKIPDNDLLETPAKKIISVFAAAYSEDKKEPRNLSKNLLQDYEAWKLEFDQWKNEKNTQLYKLFHIIESCSKSVLNNSANAFLKYLALYQKEFSDKNDELGKKKNQIDLYFKSSNQIKLMISYLTQYQKWFDEIFQRIIVCRTLIFQNEQNSVIQESPRLPSAFADNRAEFNNLLTFYLGATDKYNKLRDNLIDEENKLSNLNRNFIKQVLMLGSLDGMEKEDHVLSEFSKQLDIVNQLKLAIEQEFKTKQNIKEKLSLIASPEIVKFYLSRIDPYDADSLKNTESHLLSMPPAASCGALLTPQESNVYSAPMTFYYLPPPADIVQPYSQIFYLR